MRDAEETIVKYVQSKAFQTEIEALESSSRDQGDIRRNTVARSSPIYKLDPKIDGGIVRVGGRLSRSSLPIESKHPVILPKKSNITDLIMDSIHKTVGHSGRNHMISHSRRQYWIINVNSAARRIINKCIICKKHRGKVQMQKMADLPKERVLPDEPPFSRVGMDYFGPFEVKRGRSLVKRYGVIFTCMAVRAIHIEMADSLDTDSCINSIRRFIARRGQVKEIRSDNGTNLVGASKVLKAEIHKWNHAQINEDLLQKNVKWSFNPPAASHFGGVWERQIRTIRKVMLSILKEQPLTDEGLRTLLCEVEAIVNSRPITKVSEDANDLETLTPNHLLLLKAKPLLPPTISQENDKYRRRWRQVQYLADLFWRRWTQEYLPQLQERQKWEKTVDNVNIGDIVLIVNNSAHRGSWPLGRVIKTVPDKNGLVRSVEVKTKTGVLYRPISKLIRLLEGEN